MASTSLSPPNHFATERNSSFLHLSKEEKKPAPRPTSSQLPVHHEDAEHEQERAREQFPQPVVLLPSQYEHVAKLTDVLARHRFAMDFSMLGTGKTYTASYIAGVLGVEAVVVVCPVSVKPKWQAMRRFHGVPVRLVVGYCEMRSVRCKQPKHQLLLRRDYTVMQQPPSRARTNAPPLAIDKVDFSPSRKWLDMVDAGVLLIFDEVQHLKNVSSQFAAAQALIRPVVEQSTGRRSSPSMTTRLASDETERGADEKTPDVAADVQPNANTNTDASANTDTDASANTNNTDANANTESRQQRSRVMMLSGSPFDKVDQVTTMLRTLGVMKRDELGTFVPSLGETRLTGLQDVIDYCAALNPVETRRVHCPYDMRQRAYQLFQRVIKPAQASSMPPSPSACRIHKANAFYEIHDPDERHRLARGVEALASACMYNPDHGGSVNFATTGGREAGSIQRVTLALLQIETAKLDTLRRVAETRLSADPRTKVVICVNYSASITDLRASLARWDPLVMNGSVSAAGRAHVMRRFQEPTSRHRLLLCNVFVCSTGIDLDDKNGAFPRLVLVSPNYSTISLYQLGQRFLRADTRSDTCLHFVFGKHAHEDSVLRALAKKSAVMRATTEDQANKGIVFPGDYPAWVEGE